MTTPQPAKRNCLEPHPTVSWQGPGGLHPYRCVLVWDHSGRHRAVYGVSEANPEGTVLEWP